MNTDEQITMPAKIGKSCIQSDGTLRSTESALSDVELLQRFITRQDDLAFAELVTRHAARVMGVCRRALGNEQDAEDAFQATFLVLARKAATVRRAASLSAWLYQTAYRISLRARTGRARRREQPMEGEVMAETEAFSHIAREYEQVVLDEEFNRLPEKYRLPLFLCCVEGMSRDQAAKRLVLSAGAVKGRLERARRLLRHRLLLRGVSLSVAIVVLPGLHQTVPVIAPSLVAATVHAGVQHSAGRAALGFVSQNALSLANGSCLLMSLATPKTVACCLAVLGAVAIAGARMPAPANAGRRDGDTVNVTALAAKSDIKTAEAFAIPKPGKGTRQSIAGSMQSRPSSQVVARRRRGAGARPATPDQPRPRRGDGGQPGQRGAGPRRSGNTQRASPSQADVRRSANHRQSFQPGNGGRRSANIGQPALNRTDARRRGVAR